VGDSTEWTNGKAGRGLSRLQTYLLKHRFEQNIVNCCRKLLGHRLGRRLLLSDELTINNMAIKEHLGMESKLGTIHNADCVKTMNDLPEGGVDLVFADPPFNIGYQYDVYEDRLAADDYLKWSNEWMTAVHRVLKSDGTFWLAIGDDFAAELKIEARRIGFHCRSWVIWYYTFGVNCTNKFTRSHTHLFHFVKDPTNFTFRSAELTNRVPSARMLVYNDKRAKGDGRLPDDTWIIPPESSESFGDAATFALRPQELESRFDGTENTWYIPRVAGTFKERAGFHGCQMPEQLLGRIIRTCSESNDIVVDPFSGSASTLVTAKKLGRRILGIEMSRPYAKAGQARLAVTRVGDPLDGSPEPTMDAFRKSQVAKQSSRRTSSNDFAAEAHAEVLREHHEKVRADLERGIVAAFSKVHEGYSTDFVLADPAKSSAFADACKHRGLPGNPGVWNRLLLRIRKRNDNPLPRTEHQFALPFADCEPFLFASEIAWKILIDQERAGSLDDILCDPYLAAEFDEMAGRFAPGFTSLQYRWGALRIRKFAKTAKAEAEILRIAAPKKLGRRVPAESDFHKGLPDGSGVYIISEKNSEHLYVGGTFSIRTRLEHLFKSRLFPAGEFTDVGVQFYRTGTELRELLGWTSWFVSKAKKLPRFNVPDLRMAK